MKKIYALTALALLALLFAPTASAIFWCGECELDQGNARCIGVCNGNLVRFCIDWFHYGCTGWLTPPTVPSEEAFVHSLRVHGEPAPTALETLLAPKGQLCTSPATP